MAPEADVFPRCAGGYPVFRPRVTAPFDCGMLTGRTSRDQSGAAKAPHVLDTIADLLPLAGVSASAP